jgi:hypothetical protein
MAYGCISKRSKQGVHLELLRRAIAYNLRSGDDDADVFSWLTYMGGWGDGGDGGELGSCYWK